MASAILGSRSYFWELLEDLEQSPQHLCEHTEREGTGTFYSSLRKKEHAV